MNKIKLAIVGAHGLPAKYGGFCTLAEYLAEYKPDDFDVTVYCVKSEFPNGPDMYKGCHLVYLNASARGMMAWKFHDKGIKHAISNGADCILLCGSNGGFSLPFYHKHSSKFYLNIGGIEWARSKYNYIMQWVVRTLMKVAVRNSGHLVADNIGIKDYIKEEYHREDCVVIAYGGDQAQKEVATPEIMKKYPFMKGDYAVAIARIQPDNNTDMLLEAFKNARMPLVYIGNWNVSEYGIETRNKYSGEKNLYLLDAIYEIHELNMIRSNCSLYIHGHSAGGTNPSLVEAMFLGVPIVCYDNGFNNNTTFHKAFYFKSVKGLQDSILTVSPEKLKENAETMKSLAYKHYQWKTIAEQYYDFFRDGIKRNNGEKNRVWAITE